MIIPFRMGQNKSCSEPMGKFTDILLICPQRPIWSFKFQPSKKSSIEENGRDKRILRENPGIYWVMQIQIDFSVSDSMKALEKVRDETACF